MRFLLDESADARLLVYLRSLGHDATRIAGEHPAGLPDQEVLGIACREQRILIAADRDFGDLVVRQRLPHCGVILFRLGDFAPIEVWTDRLEHVLRHHEADLLQLVVVTRQQIRIRRQSGVDQ